MEKSDAGSHLGEILKEEPPLHKHERNVYIDPVREHFAEIHTLRKKGYGFIQICRALIKDAKLPEDANVRYLRQAFHRECRKQERDGVITASLNGSPKQVTKKVTEKPMKKETISERGPSTAEALEKERRQKLGFEAGADKQNGRVVRNTNGGFDF